MEHKGLHAIWNSNRDFFHGKGVQQILSMCGDGELKDGNPTSTEFRHFLTLVFFHACSLCRKLSRQSF